MKEFINNKNYIVGFLKHQHHFFTTSQYKNCIKIKNASCGQQNPTRVLKSSKDNNLMTSYRNSIEMFLKVMLLKKGFADGFTQILLCNQLKVRANL